MPYNSYKKTNATKPLNWKLWLSVIIGILLLFPLYRYIKKQLSINNVQQDKLEVIDNYVANQNPQTAQSKADKITPTKSVQKSAKDIAHHLGVKYNDNPTWTFLDPTSWSIFDPKGWTENDAEVAKIVIFQRVNYAKVARLYNEVYTANRNLSTDLRKLLDKTELQKVQKYLNI